MTPNPSEPSASEPAASEPSAPTHDGPRPTPPSVAALKEARAGLRGDAIESPVLAAPPGYIQRALPDSDLRFKLEALQPTGSFKPRAAILWARSLTDAQRSAGLVTVSAGNHAMAVAYAAGRTGSKVTVVMPKTADPARVAGARRLGATVELLDTVHAAFARVDEIVSSEGRTFVHPFEGPMVALGTGTIALELHEQCGALDAVIVPIGGGGLCAGIAAAMKQLQPQCRVYGVEPTGADSMHRSFASGTPESIEAVRTIADSLGAPHAAPYSFALCRDNVDALAMVDDDDLCEAMAMVHADLKLAVEPAGAAATAAAVGPLRDGLAGKRVALIVCGANVEPARWAELVTRGQQRLAQRDG